MKRFNSLALAVGTLLSLCSTLASAEQTIGIQTAAVPAIATARVNLRVIVPKIIVLRVGAADATISDVTLTVSPTPPWQAHPATAWSTPGAVPPVLGVAAATTNPVSATGALAVGAWTNGAGATMTCARSALGGATTFAPGADGGWRSRHR